MDDRTLQAPRFVRHRQALPNTAIDANDATPSSTPNHRHRPQRRQGHPQYATPGRPGIPLRAVKEVERTGLPAGSQSWWRLRVWGAAKGSSPWLPFTRPPGPSPRALAVPRRALPHVARR